MTPSGPAVPELIMGMYLLMVRWLFCWLVFWLSGTAMGIHREGVAARRFLRKEGGFRNQNDWALIPRAASRSIPSQILPTLVSPSYHPPRFPQSDHGLLRARARGRKASAAEDIYVLEWVG